MIHPPTRFAASLVIACALGLGATACNPQPGPGSDVAGFESWLRRNRPDAGPAERQRFVDLGIAMCVGSAESLVSTAELAREQGTYDTVEASVRYLCPGRLDELP